MTAHGAGIGSPRYRSSGHSLAWCASRLPPTEALPQVGTDRIGSHTPPRRSPEMTRAVVPILAALLGGCLTHLPPSAIGPRRHLELDWAPSFDAARERALAEGHP